MVSVSLTYLQTSCQRDRLSLLFEPFVAQCSYLQPRDSSSLSTVTSQPLTVLLMVLMGQSFKECLKTSDTRMSSPNSSNPLQDKDTKRRLTKIFYYLPLQQPVPGPGCLKASSLSWTWTHLGSRECEAWQISPWWDEWKQYVPMLGTEEQPSPGNWLVLSSDKALSRVAL